MTRNEFIQRYVISAATRPEVYQGSEIDRAKKMADLVQEVAPFDDEFSELKMQIVQLAKEWVDLKTEMSKIIIQNQPLQ